MRRTLAGLLFGLAYACAGLSIGGFLLQRTAFDPDASSSSAGVILGDPALKKEIVNFVVDNSATAVIPAGVANPPLEIERLRRLVAKVANNPAGQQFFAKIIHDAHARMIGDQRGPVTITGQELVPIVRNQAAAAVPDVVLPVPRITALVIINHVLDWLVPILAIATIALVIVGLASHPERDTLFKSGAIGLVALAVVTVLIGYVVPRFLLPRVNKSVWTRVPARMAQDQLPFVIGISLLMVGGSLALLAGSGMMRRRRRWSQPISTYRYAEERRWT